MADLILYRSDDTSGKCQMAAGLAVKKYPSATLKDLAGLTEANITTYIGTLSANTYSNICVCTETPDAHAAGQPTTAQCITLIPLLLTANQGTNLGDTVQSNSTVTEIIILKTNSIFMQKFFIIKYFRL